jgi:hypothetical protein
VDLPHRLALELIVILSHPRILASGSCPEKVNHIKTDTSPFRQFCQCTVRRI